MSTITRAWVAFCAIGAGLVHLALVVGSPPPLAVALVAIGAAELVWGIAAMASADLPLPRIAFAGALAPTLLWAAVLLVDVAFGVAVPLSFFPLLAATALGIVVAAVIGTRLRRTESESAARPAPGAVRYLVGLLAGALVVASITTPALAATEAGRYARPHGEHSQPLVNLRHGGHP